jgi:thiamine monophosphate synthase
MILLAITQGLGCDRGSWRRVLHAGVDGFLIREKDLSARALLDVAHWCQDTAPAVALWVAGRLDVAYVAGCGLHAPEAHPDIPVGVVPLSRPLHDEAQWPGRSTVDQLLVSPVFSSPGKGAPWGAERLHHFLDSLPEGGPQVLALGGVNSGNHGDIRHPRLAGIAAIRPFWGADPAKAVEAFRP